MTNEFLHKLVQDVDAEAHDDYVGLWVVVRGIRSRAPRASDAEVSELVCTAAAQLLAIGARFGQFDADQRFAEWPADTTVNRIHSEMLALRSDPDIGDVGWFTHRPPHVAPD